MRIAHLYISSFLISVFTCFLTACNFSLTATNSTNFHIRDGGLLSGDTCGPPCLWGIIPGITTKSDTFELLEAKGVPIKKCDYSQRQNPDQSELRCGQVDFGYSLGIAFYSSGIVKGISFTPEFSVTLDEVVARYGNPDSVSVFNLNVSELPRDLGIQLYYDQLQTVLFLPNQEENAVITSNLGIVEVMYSDAQSYMETKRYSQPWHGFSQYSENQ
jgi:hypothetical protein